MRGLIRSRLLAILGTASLATAWTAAAASATQVADAAATNCAAATLPVEDNRIWVDLAGSGDLTIVFEAGFGNDSSVWAPLLPRVRALGVRTLIYDRARMGKSSIGSATPYSIDHDVAILRAVLTTCGVRRRIVFVGHSYGGAIGLLAASADPEIRGLVLLDAVVPGVWTSEEVQRNLAAMRPQYDQIRKEAPDLAKVAIPWAEAMPRTAARVNGVAVSESLPIIDIKAEKGQADPVSAQTWMAAHQRFTQGHAGRTFVLAKGSSHKVMADQPELVLNAITEMVRTTRR